MHHHRNQDDRMFRKRRPQKIQCPRGLACHRLIDPCQKPQHGAEEAEEAREVVDYFGAAPEEEVHVDADDDEVVDVFGELGGPAADAEADAPVADAVLGVDMARVDGVPGEEDAVAEKEELAEEDVTLREAAAEEEERGEVGCLGVPGEVVGNELVVGVERVVF